MLDAPLFEVTTPATNAAARRLTTAANVNALLGQSATTDQTLIETIIDQVSAECVGYANLARAPSGAVPTFGQEVVKATWLIASWYRSSRLLLPWRTPITAFGTVVEDGANLARQHRLSAGRWRRAGANGAPPALEGQVIEQVKTRFLGRKRDPALRAEATQDVGSASYGVIGGDSISEGGMLKSLEGALDDYRRALV
jgi:hypothetical protein